VGSVFLTQKQISSNEAAPSSASLNPQAQSPKSLISAEVSHNDVCESGHRF
jgi:hypothetical protein